YPLVTGVQTCALPIFPDAKILKINDDKNPLYIPFWLMNFDELSYFLVGAKSTDDQRPEYRRFRDLITDFKKESCKLKSGDVNPRSEERRVGKECNIER